MKKLIVLWLTICLFLSVNVLSDVFITQDDRTFTVYLDSPISEPKDYRQTLILLKKADKKDTIVFVTTTWGGDAVSAMILIDAIKKTKAQTIGYINGVAFSAGSMIVLSCNKVEINDLSCLMIHSLQLGGLQGSLLNLTKQSKFFDDLNRKIINTAYKDFLNDSEIDRVIKGEELWFNSEELKVRLKRMGKLYDKI